MLIFCVSFYSILINIHKRGEERQNTLFWNRLVIHLQSCSGPIQRLLMVIPFSFIYGGSREVKSHIEDSANSRGWLLIIFC